MYLKSLDMHGFKSFADRTRLEFHPGVTGIVGPNGCGKSNVVDAIRWVLGETSAKSLRGDEMADVIFNGTETRRPLGMAEVMLTLTGCETALPGGYHEVCIGRRVYRDGKSEYLINRTPCRLRDIQDLFADTGIGRACYSIMQQGKIDLLLSSKPEDRRQVFEEAAGITKFNQQKREALRKLESTEANLLRITDVLEEQQRQMSSLQRQASKARRYAVLLQHLQVLDTHWSHRHYEQLQREHAQAAQSLSATREEQQVTRHGLASLQSALVQRRAALQDSERQIRESLHALSEAAARIDSAQKQVEFNEQRCSEWQTLIARHDSEIASLSDRLEREKSELSAAGEELHRHSSHLLDQEERLAGALVTLSRQRNQRLEQERLHRQRQQQLAACDSSTGSHRARLDALSSQIQTQEDRRLELTLTLSGAEAALVARAREKEALERGVEKSRTALERLRLEQGRLEASAASCEQALRHANTQLHERSRHLASQQARVEMLRQLASAGEGLETGTRQVLQGLDDPDRFLPSVRGALVSFLQVDDECLAAVEAALGPAIQAVLVADAAAAASILDALRVRKLGQAWLAPSVPGITAASPAPDGSLGWLIDSVEAAEPGRSVLERLLHGIALAPDLDAALRLHQTHPGLGVATLAGELISADGIISGGFRNPQAGSALRIQKEIRKLRKLTRDLESEVSALEKEARSESGLVADAGAKLAKHREALRLAELESACLESQRNVASRELELAGARRQQLLAESGALDRLRESALRQRTDLEEKLRLFLAEREDLAQGLPHLEEELRQLQLLEEETAGAAALLRTEVAVEKQSAESLRQQLAPLSSRLQELERSLLQRRTEKEELLRRIDSTQAESERLRRDIAEARRGIGSMREAHETLLQQREILAREIDEMEEALNTRRQAESELTQRAAAIEVRMAQHELRLENLADQISQRYKIDLQRFSPDLPALLSSIEEQRQAPDRTARTLYLPEPSNPGAAPLLAGAGPDWRFVEEILPGMRRRLDSLGPVNLEAIAEFEALEDRFRLIRTQHEDLTRSRDDLVKIIARINRTTRQMFAETFEQIAVNFRAMFTELFGRGSHAALVLQDDQDPLACGIDVIAKPPGKKLQSINLLSGGERSMTAVALLFAIYLVKPSPFCVLDELDAPLDEANIERFCRVLDRFCNQSQFIIVTHSKLTMHRADVMYGISMEERGVSKTLSVQLAPAAVTQ